MAKQKQMKVLVACEFSGIVREAFAARGWNAWSCDLLASERIGQHIQGDVLWLLDAANFDLMIAHPPCTYLAVSGARYFSERVREQGEALDFVRSLLDAPVKYIALENPVGVISSRIRKPDQIVQPWMFGHSESKKTCLWLKNLPPLSPTNVLALPEGGRWQNQTPTGQNNIGPSADRWKMRSRTYTGIADAMAEQWTSFIQASERSERYD